MSVDLARYVVALEAQTAQYVQQLDKASRKLDAFHRDQTRTLARVKDAFIGFGQGIVGALSVQALVRFSSESIRMADQIGKVAKASDITAEELQKLRFAFSELGGITNQQTDQGLQRFNRTLGQAITGAKEASDQFAALRVDFRGLDTQDALGETLRALAGITDDATRAARASKLFGEELGPKLAASLKGGIAELERTKAQITGMLSESTVKDAERLSDAFARLGTSLSTRLQGAAVTTLGDLGALVGFINRGTTGQLERDIEGLTDKINALQEAARRGSLGGNQFMLDDAIAERARLERQLRLEQQKVPFAERQQRYRNQQQGEQFQFPSEMITQDEWVALESWVHDLNQVPAAVGKLTPEMDAFIERAREADKLTQSMRTETEMNLERWQRTKELFDEGFLDKATLERVWDDILKPIEQIPEKLKPIKAETDAFTKELGQGFKAAFADWLVDGEFKFKEFLKRLVAQWVASKIFKDIEKVFGKDNGGGGGSVLGGIFGGFLADGGPLDRGKWYIAGEHGPEPVWGGGAGAFATGYKPMAGTTVVINQNIEAGLPPQWEAQLAGVGTLAASAAYEAVTNRLGGRR